MNRLGAATTVLALAVSGAARAAEPLQPAKLLALVNGRPITVDEVAASLRLSRTEPASAPHEVWLTQLDTAINRALLLAAAKAERGAARNGGGGSPDALIRTYLDRKFGAKLFVSANEVQKWYERHKRTLITGEIRIARVITIGARKPKRDFVTDERAEARTRIDAIRTKAVAGEDFAGLARKHSMDPYAARGGRLPPVRKTGGANFAAEVFKIENNGDVSDVFETPFGLHIVKLEGARPSAVPPLGEVETQIRQTLRRLKWGKHVAPHLAQLRGRADIRIMKSALPGADVDKSPTQPRPTPAD